MVDDVVEIMSKLCCYYNDKAHSEAYRLSRYAIPQAKPIADPVDTLKDMVKAAQEEFDHALACHETWKPTVEEGVIAAMGESYASHAFLVVKIALRREVLLALMRLWDTDKRAIRMSASVNVLGALTDTRD